MTERAGTDAERVLERAQEDPAYEAALRDAYRGRHDILDALWWAAHPLTDSARGVPDPAVERRQLQRAAYARASDPSQAADNMRRLQEAERQLSEDAQLLTDAVDTADRGSNHPPDMTHEADAEAATAPRRKLLLPIAAGVALLAAILFVPSLTQPGVESGESPAATARSAERIPTNITTLGADGNITDPLAILERPQAETDLPPDRFPLSHDPESFRALPNLVEHIGLFLARDIESGDVCLVVVREDNSAMSGCLPEERFVTTGMEISSPNRYEISDRITILTESFSLLATGEFRYQATARVTGELSREQGTIVG